MGLLHDPEEEEVRAGTTFQSTDFDLEWHLSSADDELHGLCGRDMLHQRLEMAAGAFSILHLVGVMDKY